MRKNILFVTLLGVSLLAGCAPVPTTPVVAANPFPPVPPPPMEVIPKPPVSAQPLLWQPGHWDWNGSSYAWLPGEYVPASGHAALFQTGYWQQTPTGWVWVKAHWTS
jgi:hypothetical protein